MGIERQVGAKLWRLKDIKNKLGREMSTPEQVQRRILQLCTRRIVVPYVQEGMGIGSTRYYGLQNMRDLVVALDLMDLGVTGDSILKILEEFRRQWHFEESDELVWESDVSQLRYYKNQIDAIVKNI